MKTTVILLRALFSFIFVCAFLTSFAQGVTVLSPTGTEELKFGDPITITWDNDQASDTDLFYLYYQVNGGSLISIESNRPKTFFTNNGTQSSYDWTVPDLGTNLDAQVTIRVLNNTLAVQDDSEPFRAYYESSVAVTSPTGTEELKFGEPITITWDNGDHLDTDRFYVYYQVNGGSPISIESNRAKTFFTVDGNTCSYDWTVPDLGTNLDAQVNIRVLNVTRNVQADSEPFRAYYESSVEVLTPFPNEFLEPGGTSTITWDNGDHLDTDRFYLYYQVNDGSLNTIESNRPKTFFTVDGSTCSYEWTMPGIETENLKVRVLNVTRNVFGNSLAMVMCTDCLPISIYSPNGGEVYGVGDDATIGWTLSSSTTWQPTDNILVEVSADGGATYETPAIYDGQYDAVSGNQFPITIPDLLTDQGMIRITNITTGDTDTSNGTFQIVETSLAPPSDIFAQENTGGSITLMWSDNETAETGYRIQFSEDNQTWTNYSGNLAADTETFTTGALTPGTSYWWRVQAYNEITTAESTPKFAGRITPPGNALAFDGLDDQVTLADPTAFNFGTGDFTMETWVRFDDLTGTQVIISDYNGTVAGSMGIALRNDGSLGVYLSSSSYNLTSAAGLIEDGQWYHVALVREIDNATLYLNGLSVGTTSGITTLALNSAVNMSLGYQPSGSPFYLEGEMDEVRFWTVARTETEISDHLYTTLVGNETGLIAYYRFDQPENSMVLPDRTINDLDGVVNTEVSSPQWVTSGAMTEPMFTLQVLTPNSGEVLEAGTTQTIAWFSENIEPTDLIEIQLSTDGGANYSIIADGTFATYPEGTFEWIVPEINTSQARIRVVNTTTGLSDASDANFTITIPVEPTISLITPEGGEFWEIGSQQLIQWVSEGFESEDFIEVNVSRDGGENYELIGEGSYGNSYPNDQMFWVVEGLASDDVFVQVNNTTKGISATSAVALSIGTITRTISLTSPNGGEQLQQQTEWTFVWTSEGMEASNGVKIEVSVDGGETFPYIPLNSTFGAVSDNQHIWNSGLIPTSDNAIVRITNTTYAISDISDEPFTILPAADVTAPSFNSAPSVTIGNQDYNLTVNLNEVSTVYFVALSDGSSLPNASQVKAAVVSEEPLTGQVASGSFEYVDPFSAQSFAGSGDFAVGSQYDFYFTAEDADANLNAGYGVPNVLAVRVLTPAENDSSALITMFDEMGGENWDIANNWRETPIAQWEEVELSEEENRVIEINLDGKGLVGQMPEIMNQLDQLQSFILPNNEVTYIPNFSEVSSIQTLDVKQNRLDFTSIVANISVTGFDFKDQRRFGELIERELLDAGSSRTLTAPYLGSGVTYQWQFGPLIPGKSFNDNVEVIDGSGQVYTIQNISAVNQGTYRFIATHPSVEDFAIEGRNQNIFAKTDIAGTIRSDGSPISGGEVVIYRQTPEGPFAKEDSTTVGTNGDYALTDVVLGNFIVQVKPDREANPTSIQTYYISAESYDEADTLFLDSRMENIDIDLLFYTPAPTPETGATVAGTLESDFEEDTVDQGDLRVNGRRRVKKAGCAMRRFKAQGRPDQDEAETEIAYYLETDDEGYFSFEGVEPGRYLINIEFPGVPMNPESEVEFFIDPDKENQVFSVEALITESGIEIEQTEVLFTWKPYVKDVIMYPNPTDGILGMDYTVYRDINDLQIKVTNIEGRTLMTQEAIHIRGRHHTIVNVTDLPSGIYFITLTDRAGTFSDQFKVSRK
ncbi:MAG: LamG-like jellyroll fold domain-containing protein [Cyclobacteriaceae bacterium]